MCDKIIWLILSHSVQFVIVLYHSFVFVSQLHDLKIGILERNQVIEEMQRHLLVQEVTNKLLEADNERWELELQFFKRQRKAAILKRWQTFTGRDMPTREVRHNVTTVYQLSAKLLGTIPWHSILK